jgi:hypothetical protein
MKDWVLRQGIEPKLVTLITDENGPVDLVQIKRVLFKLAERGDIEQLLVYFSGHGVNIRYGEYWLLSDAPTDTQAAVNVEGSVALARLCGIPHVVMISNACRTAAETLQAQAVTGGEIFPNDATAGMEGAIDQFFACLPGRPALEIKDLSLSAGEYKAVYTESLLEALEGKHFEVLDIKPQGSEWLGWVRPRKLGKYLEKEVPRRTALHSVNQQPSARITSDDDEAWLA